MTKAKADERSAVDLKVLTLHLVAAHGNFYYEFQRGVDANEGGHHYAEKTKQTYQTDAETLVVAKSTMWYIP